VNDIQLQITDLRAGYGTRVVLDQVSLSLNAGEWFVLMGPNGSGKTTLLDCVAGRLKAAAGTIRIAGCSLVEDALGAKRQLGFGCPPDSLPGLLSARQCFEVHAGAKGVAAVDTETMALAEEMNFSPYLDSFVDTLSLGTRQKLSVLLSLIGDPKLIVLDEAFNGLDPASSLVMKRHLRNRLEQRGATLLLATHALDIVEHYADRAGLLIDGRLTKEWHQSELAAIRVSGQGFDRALAQAASS
jgi:ABC-2 type transport system ATP-binding protein